MLPGPFIITTICTLLKVADAVSKSPRHPLECLSQAQIGPMLILDSNRLSQFRDSFVTFRSSIAGVWWTYFSLLAHWCKLVDVSALSAQIGGHWLQNRPISLSLYCRSDTSGHIGSASFSRGATSTFSGQTTRCNL